MCKSDVPLTIRLKATRKPPKALRSERRDSDTSSVEGGGNDSFLRYFEKSVTKRPSMLINYNGQVQLALFLVFVERAASQVFPD